ncbi:type II toxin-antitoxin system RelE/ParE family toxin [Leeuwenhoekiella parthenopeia]|uniref:Type II toxin-antitoxin system RelE/ParE family toxin n=1 Tax=Leeuwenhoekiella parthenopeia TaxID=2890320 RepID=A0ABS8GV58_9FLAO|nr:type II toxin-antitoxin system RelE/ParE family toxin [Leeuwenhoekiella parthenopeia]MCC4213891.1 type II toxin-antitoxin system RelE/ParE family toxin [Leeuwenhoekiella parthenopeia]
MSLQVVWLRQAIDSLKNILDYRYKDIPSARAIVKRDILNASKGITFPEQYQQDEINADYRKILVRDYKLLYKEIDGVIYISNVICTKASLQ